MIMGWPNGRAAEVRAGHKQPWSTITTFQRRVYAVVRSIPRGRVMTYGALARAVGCGSARAVGQALRSNPFAPHVPCHRVIGSDLRVGGFRGRRGGPEVGRKLTLLAAEGVRFVAGKLADPARVWRVGELTAPRRTGR
mgnify:CR=1 FL=1